MHGGPTYRKIEKALSQFVCERAFCQLVVRLIEVEAPKFSGKFQ